MIKTRIAPTPSGFLHIGNALSFAVTWALAKQQHGTLALRIDDLDNTRSRPEYLEDIFQTIEWLGLDYQEGPKNPHDFLQHYSQQLHVTAYQDLLHKLISKNMLYACDCSRSAIVQQSTNGTYPRTCLHKGIPLDTPEVAWRIKTNEDLTIRFQDLTLGTVNIPLGREMSDFVVRRKDGIPSYQIASLCDDLSMKCNLIVRGKDLLNSTAAQIFIDQAIDSNTFSLAEFVHHPLVKDLSGNKLSKSKDAFALINWRQSDEGLQKVWETLSSVFNWTSNKPASKELFLERFSLSQLSALE